MDVGKLALAAAAACSMATASRAATAIPIDDTGVFPESLTATAGGDIIVGSSAKGTIYRAKAGETKAGVWIDPKTSGMVAVLGVFADDRRGLLYVCSAGLGAPPDKADALSALRSFDLKTGAAKASYAMPGGAKALCNDIATARDGTAFVSETRGGQVLALKPGAAALTAWASDPRLAGIDGIAMGGDGALYVNTVTTGRMFRIAIAPGGAAGAITELTPSSKLDRPDGLRALGGLKFLQAENGPQGKVAEVDVSGDAAKVTALKDVSGMTSAVKVKGQVWAINAKFAIRNDPAMKGKDPGPFAVEPIP